MGKRRRAMIALIVAACSFAACAGGAPSGGTSTRTASVVPSTDTPVASSPTLAPSQTVAPPATGTPAPEPSPIPSPVPGPARIVYRGNAARRMVALTFDAGSDAGFTAQILDTLRAAGVRASFSLTGKWVEENRDLALAITADGFRLINHSYDHASFTGRSTDTPPLDAAQRSLELSRTETTVYHLTSRTTRPYFRPPYGDVDASVQRDVGADGYDTIVMWTVDTLGWQGASADAIVARVLANAEPGAIYVLHVGSQSQDAAALPRIIDGLRAEGYSFGTIDDVLAP